MSQPGPPDCADRCRGGGCRRGGRPGRCRDANFDPNSYKPQIIEAVKRATGRDLALNGKIGLEAVAVADDPGGGCRVLQPARVSRVRRWQRYRGWNCNLALLPLLSSRIEINRLVLIHPDILLETDAERASPTGR